MTQAELPDSPSDRMSEGMAAPTVPLPQLSSADILDAGDDLIGKRIGQYRLDRKLGQGGFGSVYHGSHCTLKRETAVKLLSPAFASDQSFVARFEREARAAARLEHPGIVQVYDVGQDGGLHYIAMQFVDGITLEKLLDNRKRLPAGEAISILKRVASALEYAHQGGVIHRDIKPANILISKDSKIKVADFGLARDLIDAGTASITGQVMGTPHFMPPEQGRGEKVDERSDVYALGATMYCILTGRVPFVGNSALSVIMKHATDPLVPPVAVDPNIPRRLSDLVVAMMAKNPAERPQTMGAVIQALDALKDGNTAVIRGLTTPAPGAPGRKRMPILIALAALLLLVGVGVGVNIARKRSNPTRALESAIEFARDHSGDRVAVINRYREVVTQNAAVVEVSTAARVALYQQLRQRATELADQDRKANHDEIAALGQEASEIRGHLLTSLQHHGQEPFARDAWKTFLKVETDVIRERADGFQAALRRNDTVTARSFVDPSAPDQVPLESVRERMMTRLRRLFPALDEKTLDIAVRSVGLPPNLQEKVGELADVRATVTIVVRIQRRLGKEAEPTTHDQAWIFSGNDWYFDPK